MSSLKARQDDLPPKWLLLRRGFEGYFLNRISGLPRTKFLDIQGHQTSEGVVWMSQATKPTVDGQNPAPPRMMIIPLYTRF